MTTSAHSVPLAELCCPACGGALRETGTSEPELRCEACSRIYPVILGIPDLRLFADPYIALEADRAKGRRLAERARDTDFNGLVSAYYAMPDTEDTAQQARLFAAGLRRAPARSAATLEAWQRQDGRPVAGARFLEIGCGTAPLLVHAGRVFTDVIGVDIAFRWLVVARKRLEEAGVDVPLVCACAEALPFRAATRDVVAAESTFEVVRDPAAGMTEVHRVLRPGGSLWMTTPNRLSLGPDPHLGVPAGGWWPRALLERHVRRTGALPPQRQLFSASSLASRLHDTGFEAVRLGLPDLPADAREGLPPLLAAAAAVYGITKHLPVAKQLLLAVGPVLLATARRDGLPNEAPASPT